MKTIHKFVVPELDGLCVIEMPKGARILSAQVQRGSPTLWALVDTIEPKICRTFFVIGTGIPFHNEEAPKMIYVGTFELSGRHLFEVPS